MRAHSTHTVFIRGRIMHKNKRKTNNIDEKNIKKEKKTVVMGFLSRSNRAFRMPSMSWPAKKFLVDVLLLSFAFNIHPHRLSYIHPHPRVFWGKWLMSYNGSKPLNSPF